MRRIKILILLSLFILLLLITGFKFFSFETDSKNKQSHTISSQLVEGVEEDNIDPKAVDILRNSLNYFANLKFFSAKTQSTVEDILQSGHKVDFEFAGKVVLQRPNHLRSERYGEQMHQIFFYDGKTLTLYNPDEKVYATEPTPGTIDNMFHVARDSFGISVPISDLVYSNSFELLYQDINYAIIIGKEIIGDVQCDHLLFSREDVDFQIWSADSGPPLPYKYVVTDKTTPELFTFSTSIYDWNLNPDVPDNFFDFVPPKGTQKIDFLNHKDEN